MNPHSLSTAHDVEASMPPPLPEPTATSSVTRSYTPGTEFVYALVVLAAGVLLVASAV